MPKELMFAPMDLLEFNIGPPVLQLDRQKRIIGSLLELGFIATNMEGYMGPRLDDVTLGTLGPGEFFGELVRTFVQLAQLSAEIAGLTREKKCVA